MTEERPLTYWLFAGDNYYPTGGLGDLVGSYKTQEEASAEGKTYDWYEIATLDGPRPKVIEGKNVFYFYSGDESEWPIEDVRDDAFDPNEYPPGGMRATEN